MENKEIFWSNVLSKVQSKISAPSYDTWIKQTSLKRITDDHIIIVAGNEFSRDWLESRYTDLIKEAILELEGKEFEVKFVTDPTIETAPKGIEADSNTIVSNFEANENVHKLDLILMKLDQLLYTSKTKDNDVEKRVSQLENKVEELEQEILRMKNS